MSFEPYARVKMDNSGNGTEESTESMASALKGMLKINGTSHEGTPTDPPQISSSSKSEIVEEEATQDEESSKTEATDVEVPKPSSSKRSSQSQKIDLAEASDGECVPIYGEHVTIITSPNFETDDKRTSGSNKVRIKPITKFEWEHKYYAGSLVSVTDNYTAYAIKSRSFAVRVISRKNTSDRLLLRGFSAPVCDVAFAHSSSTTVSAVDEDGNLLIWELTVDGDTTSAVKKLHVKSVFNDSTYHRLVWLTFMHCDVDGANAEQILQLEEDENIDPSINKRLLAVTHGKDVEIWDIRKALEIFQDKEDDTEKEKLSSAYMTISHDDIISDCVLSPEGSVIAVASNDGYVKFWQIATEHAEQPTCLHRWQPHGDRPVSLVTFCDDRTQSQLVLYWRFMLTGCSQNSELKIWCTVSWSCLQKISFQPSPGSTEITPSLKCVLHAAADYLVVADINRNVVYVLRCDTDLENEKASLSSISQYLLTTPMLSFAFIGAQKCKFKTLVAMDEEIGEHDDDKDEIIDSDDDDKTDDDNEEISGTTRSSKKVHGVLIQLVSINSKSLESLDIRFVPNTPPDETLSYSTYNTINEDINVVSVDDSLSVVSPSREQTTTDRPEQQDEEDEEAEESNDKTALTANDAEQSTIMTVNETEQSTIMGANETEESQLEDKESEMLKSPERPQSAQSSIKDTDVKGLVENLAAEEPPLAHSSPSVRVRYGEDDEEDDNGNRRGQGEGEASSSPEKPDGQPVLLTPDAFTSTLRKAEDRLSMETSFTHITPFTADQPSMFGSERDESFQESVRAQSPVVSSPAPPPGFPQIPSSSGIFKPTDSEGHMVQASAIRSSLNNIVSQSSAPPYQSPPHIQTVGEPGPFGDMQGLGYSTKPKSPDLISSTSSIENVGASSEGRILIGGPLPVAVGGSGDAVFLSGQQQNMQDADAGSQIPSALKRSEALTPPSSAPWPKAPDVTMSRPIPKKVSPPSTREEFLRGSSLSQQSQVSVRPDSVLHSDLVSGDQSRNALDSNLGADVLAAVMKLQSQQEEMVKTIQKDMNKKLNQNTRNIEATMKRFEQQQTERLDRAVRSMFESQKKFQSEMKSHSMSSAEHSASKMERSVKYEMRNTVVPNLAKSLDPLKEQLHTTLAQKLTATDSLLRENIAKLARSKDTVDAIGIAAGHAIQSQVHGAFKDSFSQIVVPATEKSCNMLFQQISMTFQKGMDEAVEKLEKQLKSRVRGEIERIASSEKQAREAVTELKDTATQLHTKISTMIEHDVQKYVRSEMKKVQEGMTAEMSKLIKIQNEVALKEQKAVLTECIRSTMSELQPPSPQQGAYKAPGDKVGHPVTPGRSPSSSKPTYEQQQRAIVAQLQLGNLNAAFQRALTASDLSLVVFVCEMVDPVLLFESSPCALHQPIILSLIQQLSCDLSRHTELKLRYLQEAVMSLDASHQVTQEHLPTVMDALKKNLDVHIATLSARPVDSSNHPIIKQMKILSMAAQSFLK